MTTIAIAQKATSAKATISAIEMQPQSPSATAENRLKAALEHARRLTQMHGPQSVDVAIAWETVEELQTAQSRQLAVSCQSTFARYCAENPFALECRSYDC